MQFDVNKHRSFFLAADTDSAIFTFDPLLVKELGGNYNEKFTDEEVLEKCKFYIKKYSEKLNKEYLNKLAKDKFNVVDHKFDWKTENIIKSALWTGKRRYAQYIIEKEGVKVNELDTKGLELFKSNMNPIFRDFGTKFIEDILFGVPKPQLDKNISEFYKSLKQIDPRKIGKPTGVSFINKCIKRKAKDGEMFSELEKNTKENSRAAIIYNDFLRFKGYDKKYESIIEGDKIYIINLISNPYKIDVIGLPNAKIPDEILEFVNTFIDKNTIFESMIWGKIQELYKDLNWDIPSLNENVGKFFKF